MTLIKRLHLFVLKSFIPLFAMTFFIVLFIVLMQFLWRYIDDLVGKGLSVDVLGELFFYAAVSMVPMALPLAILLASLMTFGNFGEKLELTAMKASGISLVRVMAPLIILVAGISVGAFFFQNDVLPKAQVKMWTLLFSMKQKSPEVEIPQGVFYDQIPGYSLYVKTKNPDTGMLYNVMIYDVKTGGDNATILLADSAQIAFTPDMRFLFLHLYYGEQFENLREQTSMDQNVPFRRETFEDKQILIPFDNNFNRLNEQGMRKQYVGKNIAELNQTIDSIGRRVDSIGKVYAKGIRTEMNSRFGDAAAAPRATAAIPLDTLLARISTPQLLSVYDQAIRQARNASEEYQFRSASFYEEKKSMRRHEIELMKKFTLSCACLIFFFIGAPLGAIIRKGGIGTPLVISVFLFLFYYIIDNTGYKMARDGRWDVWFGIWLSTFVLTPLGIYVTYKAMNDSELFDKDLYLRLISRLRPRGRRRRDIRYKEVVIQDISIPVAIHRLRMISDEALEVASCCSRTLPYLKFWSKGYDLHDIPSLSRSVEGAIKYLSYARSRQAVASLNAFPEISESWLLRIAGKRPVAIALGILFPLGIPLWLLATRRMRSLRQRLEATAAAAGATITILEDPEAR